MSPRHTADITLCSSPSWVGAALCSTLALLAGACGSNADQSGPAAIVAGAGGAATGGMVNLGAGGLAPSAGGAISSVGAGGTPGVGAGGTPIPSAGGAPVDTGGAPSGGAGGAPQGGAAGNGGAATDSYHLSIAIPTVNPGEENTQCIQLKLPNTAPITINKLHNTLSLGSHHFIVSALTAAGAAEAPLTPCKPFKGALAGEPLSITQKKDDMVAPPEGVGYALATNQVMHLELHYINTGTDVLAVHADTELSAAPPGSNLQESSVLLIGTLNISVPAQAMGSTGPKYIAMPSEVDGVNFYAMTGHTHRFGTNVKVSSADSATGSPTTLYAPVPYNWDSPETVRFSPPAHVTSGGGFILQCDWQNTTSNVLTFGESALQEMCFFWAYYYPKKTVSNLILEGLGPVDPAFFGLL